MQRVAWSRWGNMVEWWRSGRWKGELWGRLRVWEMRSMWKCVWCASCSHLFYGSSIFPVHPTSFHALSSTKTLLKCKAKQKGFALSQESTQAWKLLSFVAVSLEVSLKVRQWCIQATITRGNREKKQSFQWDLFGFFLWHQNPSLGHGSCEKASLRTFTVQMWYSDALVWDVFQGLTYTRLRKCVG